MLTFFKFKFKCSLDFKSMLTFCRVTKKTIVHTNCIQNWSGQFAGVCLQICQKTREHNEGRNITNRTPAETEDFYFQLWLGGSKASWWALRKLCCLRAIHGGSRTKVDQRGHLVAGSLSNLVWKQVFQLSNVLYLFGSRFKSSIKCLSFREWCNVIVPNWQL